MLRVISCFLLLITANPVVAGERIFDFNQYRLGETPAGFRSILSGGGKPGDWKVIADPKSRTNTADATAPGTESEPKVLAQLSQDGTDERFPMLVYDDETYGDFTLTTRLKMVDGIFEQMAGIAFRIQDTNNYYYVRASSLGNTFRFIKLVNGQRLTTVGPSVEIPRNVWHDLKIECKGNRISFLLNGKELIPSLTDNTFLSGKIGFWTKSDSVSYFGETQIDYSPHEILAQALVRDTLRKYPRLAGIRLYVLRGEDAVPKVIAANEADEIGQAGGKVEQDVIARDVTYYGKAKKHAIVTMPLHDRNGEVAGAIRLVLQSFPGQTEQNAVARARPIVKEMEERIRTAKDLMQ